MICTTYFINLNKSENEKTNFKSSTRNLFHTAEHTSLCIFAHNVTVRETVFDITGELLIGVTVQTRGTAIGTMTDMGGNFSFPNVPSNVTLDVSYGDMRTQSIALSGKTNIQLVLEEDTEMLEELVVVGYGQIRRSDLTFLQAFILV
jgi:hypothetical protein